MCFVHMQNLIIILGVNEDYTSSLIGPGHAVDSFDLEAQYISSGSVPGNGLALADITEEMMLRAKGDLLNLQIK